MRFTPTRPRSSHRHWTTALAGIGVLALTAGGFASAAVAASPVPVGTYVGTQDDLDSPVTFSVNGDGLVSGFSTQSAIYCFGSPIITPWADMPPTPVEDNGFFAAEWFVGNPGNQIEFRVAGIISTDGTAFGQGRATLPALNCSGNTFDWEAEVDEVQAPAPTIGLSATEISASALAASGVTVNGSGFGAGATVSFSVDGAEVATATASATGQVTFPYTGPLAPGAYTLALAGGGVPVSATLTVTADPVLDPTITLSTSEVTESALVDAGVTVSGAGFAAGSSVDLRVDGDTVETLVAGADGAVSVVYGAVLAPGSYTLALVSGSASASAVLTVVADEPAPDPEPIIALSLSSISESALTADGIVVSASGFAGGTLVSLSVDGSEVASAAASASGEVSFPFAGPLAAGTYTIAVAGGGVSASATLTVTADPVEVDPEIQLSVTEITESDLADTGVIVTGTGFAPGSAVDFTIDGAVVQSLVADGSGGVTLTHTATLAPGSYSFALVSGTASASAVVTVVADEPAPEPDVEVVLSVGQLSASALASDGVTVSGSGFLYGSIVSLTVDGSEVATSTATAAGDVSFLYTGPLAPGTYTIAVVSGSASASAVLTVVADDPGPQPTPAVSVSIPNPTVSELAAGITITATGFGAGEQLELRLGSDLLLVLGADANGAAAGVLALADVTPGAYTFVLASSTQSTSFALTVLADAAVPAPVPAPEPEPSPAPVGSGTPTELLAATGMKSDAVAATLAGGLLLLVMGGLLVLRRRFS